MSEAVGSTTSVEPLTAHPTFDVWSLGVLMYRLLSHAPLFDTDDRGKCGEPTDPTEIIRHQPHQQREPRQPIVRQPLDEVPKAYALVVGCQGTFGSNRQARWRLTNRQRFWFQAVGDL